MYATFFVGVLYLEHILGYGVLQTGVAFLPQTLVLAALSLGPTAWLVTRFGPRLPLLAGLLFGSVGLFLLGRAGPHAHYFPDVAIPFLLMGAGAGLAFMPLLTIAMANVPLPDAGLASGIVNTSLQLSAAIGVAVLGTLATNHTLSLSAHGVPHTAALLAGYHLALTIGAISVGVAILVTLVLIRAPRRAGARTEPATLPTPAEVEAEVEFL
jgi:MFS family permease